jgi:hypothetical protein
MKHAGFGPRTIPVVVQGRPSDTGDLPEERVLWQLSDPGRLRTVAWTNTQVSGHGVVGVALQVAPLLGRTVVARAGLQHEHVKPALRQLLRGHRATAARADDDHVTHDAYRGRLVALRPEPLTLRRWW